MGVGQLRKKNDALVIVCVKMGKSEEDAREWLRGIRSGQVASIVFDQLVGMAVALVYREFY